MAVEKKSHYGLLLLALLGLAIWWTGRKKPVASSPAPGPAPQPPPAYIPPAVAAVQDVPAAVAIESPYFPPVDDAPSEVATGTYTPDYYVPPPGQKLTPDDTSVPDAANPGGYLTMQGFYTGGVPFSGHADDDARLAASLASQGVEF